MSEIDSLRSFMRKKAKAAGASEPKVDWEKRKRDWLRALDQLYDQIREWLKPLDDDKTLEFLPPAPIQLDEERIGPYEAKCLAVRMGKQRINFIPKGTLVVGAEGRVDVRGPASIRSLVLMNKKWFVIEAGPRRGTVPFNAKSFQELLADILQ